jgi:hypothetical protein
MEPILSQKGVNGSLDLYENKIVIKRGGFLAFMTQGMKGDKEIQISHISAIQLKKAGTFTNGYIQFSFLGGQESQKGIMDATKDENTIMFAKATQSQFIKIKEEIEKRLVAGKPSRAVQASGLDELEKLAELKSKGIITEQEFQAKKKQILGI